MTYFGKVEIIKTGGQNIKLKAYYIIQDMFNNIEDIVKERVSKFATLQRLQTVTYQIIGIGPTARTVENVNHGSNT